MTKLEIRLRQELQDLAQRLAPADPRPLREPPARSPARRARWMAPLAAMAAMVVVIGGLVLLQRTTPAVSRNGRTADPPLVAIAAISISLPDVSYSLKMVSPRTGRVTKVVPRVATGNGFAQSPDSKNVFVVGINGPPRIRRISVATGKRSFVAYGVYPAVSPDSRCLAYATGRRFTDIAVRDLRTGGTRVINLRSLMGKDGPFINGGTVTWLGDGTEILAVPGSVAVRHLGTAGVTGTAGTASGSRAVPARFRAIVIRVRPAGLSARRIWLAGRHPDVSVIRGDLSKRRSFLIARQGWPATGTRKAVMGALVEATLRGRGVVERKIASLPTGIMPVAIAPYGDRILYLVGHTPPALWAATIRNGRLLGQHHLFTDTPKFEFDQAAW